MNFEHLKSQELPQLKELAGKMGLSVHHKAGKDKVIKTIMEAALTPQTPQNTLSDPNNFKGEDMRHKAVKPKPEEFNYTEDDVRQACAEFFAKEGFEAKFPGDGTVIVRYKGAEDSLTLKQPMSVIKRKVGIVSRGKYVLMGMNQHFDSLPVSGPNAYTNTVLS